MRDDRKLLEGFVSLIEQVVSIPIDPKTINMETDLGAELMLDSMSLVSLMTLSEEFFQIDLSGSAESIANLRTVGDALNLISALHGQYEVSK
jgi:acyl carrier protein